MNSISFRRLATQILFFSIILLNGCSSDKDKKTHVQCDYTQCLRKPPKPMNFFAFAPLKATTGQVVEFAAFLTDSNKIYFPSSGSEKIIQDHDLSKNVEFDLIIIPTDAVKRVDARKEDYYRDMNIPHKIWLYELTKSDTLELHFKLSGKDGVMFDEQKRCLIVSGSWGYFIKGHALELATLALSIIALIFTGVDSVLKILTYLKSKQA